jgi:FAD binding domain/Berberine and berberine like
MATTKDTLLKAREVLSLPDLRRTFRDRLIAPDDPRYDQARQLFYGGFDCHPAVIIRPADADDVARVIALARETHLELAIRSGGHSLAGHSISEGGIVLDLTAMKNLQIDLNKRTAWAQTGLTAGEYTQSAAEHGLATGFGDTGSVGLGGLTLGGGVGYLVRKFGLTIDDLLAAEIVTADSRILRIDADSHPDLFWAIRGGGGNFGVATRFQFRLHELPTVVGGMLILPATPDTIADFIGEAENAPEALSSIANVMVAPPMPFLPPEIHGKVVLMAMLIYAGETGAGERALEPFRKLAVPLADMIKPMRYPDIYEGEQAGFHPLGLGHNMYLAGIDRRLASTILDHLRTSTAFLAAAQLRVLGGAMARIQNDETAFSHRQSRIMVNLGVLYQDEAQKPVQQAWLNDFAASLPHDIPGAYVNFLGDEGPERVRSAYSDRTWERLQLIKSRYDPGNLFRLNQNIPPK